MQSQKWQNDLGSFSFNITVIQTYASTTDAKDSEVDQFYEDLQDLLIPKEMSFSSQGIGMQK